jgi:predicted Rossmann-fold nucleotide-binding protein
VSGTVRYPEPFETYKSMNNIVVFCGSSKGTDSIYEEHAYLLGKTLAESGIGLIYGGTKIGLIGAVADGALQHGGRVIGVLPYFLQTKEIAHESLTELILVDTMHERKTKMNSLATVSSHYPVDSALWRNFSRCSLGGNWGFTESPWGC